MSMLGAFHPGRSIFHRAGAGAKLLGLLVAGVVVVATPGPVAALGFLAAAVAALIATGAGVRILFRTLRGLLLVLVAIGAYQAWQNGWERAVETVAELVALVLLATVVTVTTPVDEVLDAITRALSPLRRVGVRPEPVALAFSLVLRAIPTTLDLAHQTRDAAVARGLERSPRARLVPLVLRVVAHARATGDALHARGITDDLGEPAGPRPG